MEGSIRGRILRCPVSSIESELGSEACFSDPRTSDSISCVEFLVKEGDDPVSPAALRGDGRKSVVGKQEETPLSSIFLVKLSGFSPNSSQDTSLIGSL